MSVPQVLLVVAAAWLAVVAIGWLVVIPFLRRSIENDDPIVGFLWWFTRAYCWFWQRARYVGVDLVPRPRDVDGLIIIANHTGAVDPLLVQSCCRFHIHWMMAADMVTRSLSWLWAKQPIIPVDRHGRDSASLRAAIRHVRGGGVVGIFPEGRITFPPREIRPFLPGAGLIIARTRAPVLLAWISGTPDTNKLEEAIRMRGRARVQFVEMIDFGDERDPEVICTRLRERIAEVSGWPLNDDVLPPGGE